MGDTRWIAGIGGGRDVLGKLRKMINGQLRAQGYHHTVDVQYTGGFYHWTETSTDTGALVGDSLPRLPYDSAVKWGQGYLADLERGA